MRLLWKISLYAFSGRKGARISLNREPGYFFRRLNYHLLIKRSRLLFKGGLNCYMRELVTIFLEPGYFFRRLSYPLLFEKSRLLFRGGLVTFLREPGYFVEG